MFEYSAENGEIIHSTFIDKGFVLGMLKLNTKSTLNGLGEDDVDDLMSYVTNELDLHEDDLDFEVDERIALAVMEWAQGRGIKTRAEA